MRRLFTFQPTVGTESSWKRTKKGPTLSSEAETEHWDHQLQSVVRAEGMPWFLKGTELLAVPALWGSG